MSGGTVPVEHSDDQELLRVALNITYWAQQLIERKFIKRLSEDGSSNAEWHEVSADLEDALDVIQKYGGKSEYSFDKSVEASALAPIVRAMIKRNGVPCENVARLAQKSLGRNLHVQWGSKGEDWQANEVCGWIMLWLEGADIDFITGALSAFCRDVVSQIPQESLAACSHVISSDEIRRWMDDFEESSESCCEVDQLLPQKQEYLDVQTKKRPE